jgi:uncharacterized membrane protein AbrB (regulator of aidB expression)
MEHPRWRWGGLYDAVLLVGVTVVVFMIGSAASVAYFYKRFQDSTG